MAEVTIGNRVYRHETKDQPTENAPGKIVEAFGLRKCPKLVEQVIMFSPRGLGYARCRRVVCMCVYVCAFV